MNGLLSMIGMQTELEYQMGDDFPFGVPRIRFIVPNGNIPSDKQKCQPKAQYEFTVRGLRLWQLLRKMLLKSIIILKSKAYETEVKNDMANPP